MDFTVWGLDVQALLIVVAALFVLAIVVGLLPSRRRAPRGAGRNTGRLLLLGFGGLVALSVAITLAIVFFQPGHAVKLPAAIAKSAASKKAFQWWALLITLLPVALATVSLYGCRRFYGYHGPNGDPRNPMNNVLSRLFLGNPTKGAISISQFSLWAVVIVCSLPVTFFFVTPAEWPLLGKAIVCTAMYAGFIGLGYKYCYSEVPGAPQVHRGIYMWMSRRTHTEFDEGPVILFPGIEELFLVDMSKRELNVEVEKGFTKGKSSMRVRTQVVWQPDEDRLPEFVQTGEDDGVEGLATDYIKEAVRAFLITTPNWSTTNTRKVLQITGVKEGKLVHEPLEEAYQTEPWEHAMTLRPELFPELVTAVTGTAVKMERKDFLKVGCPDQFHWGIRFIDIILPTILPTGKTEEAADRRAEEVQEREAELYETQTEVAQAAQLIDRAKESGITMTFPEAYQIIVDYKTAREGQGYTFPGFPQALAGFSQTLSAILEKLFSGRRES